MTTAQVASAPIVIAGPGGELEAALDTVPQTVPEFACAMCHPHPLHGGTMQNKVVTTVSRAMARLGGISLRFNYRGVGRSRGSYDDGRGEFEDALTAIRYLRATPDCADLPLVVAGFSFGGAIAYRAALETRPAALITIAPAHARIPSGSSARLAHWLLVQGDEDEVISAAGVLQWAQQHEPIPQIDRFEATGHFFHGRLQQLADSISAYLRESVL